MLYDDNNYTAINNNTFSSYVWRGSTKLQGINIDEHSDWHAYIKYQIVYICPPLITQYIANSTTQIYIS